MPRSSPNPLEVTQSHWAQQGASQVQKERPLPEHNDEQSVHTTAAIEKKALRAQRIHDFMTDVEPYSCLRETSVQTLGIAVTKTAEDRMAEKLRNFDRAFK